jgi:16S rRNA (guanine527-N7)-methyltransferase
VLVRAVADLSIAAELALGLVRVGGRLIVWKGPQIEEEAMRAQGALEQMGGGTIELLTYALPTSPKPAAMTLAVVEKIRETPANLPRSFAQIKHKPLGRE